jgi:hypothetical protein
MLVVLPCCGVPVFFFRIEPTLREWKARVPFDSDAWKATRDTEARYHMSWDLVHGNALKGKTTSEVEELLGEPGTKDHFGDSPTMPKFSHPHFERGVETWYYGLGGEKYDSGIGPSGAVLAVDFKDGKVFDVRKVIH